MHLEPLLIQVLPRLAHTGSFDEVKGTLDLSSIDIGHRHFDVPEGISYDLLLTNTGEAVLLSGKAKAELKTKCDRCLEILNLDITGETQGYYLFDKASVKEGESREEYEEVDRKGRIDIAPVLLAAVVFEIPTVNFCKADCKGIEFEDPAQEEQAESKVEEAPPSPFAALKDFKFEE